MNPTECPGGDSHGLDTSGICPECFDLALEQEYAESYAVASIIYYSDTGVDTGLSDAQYDGLCDWLLRRQVWKRIPWIERDLLLTGSGYDTSGFPVELHERAQASLQKSASSQPLLFCPICEDFPCVC